MKKTPFKKITLNKKFISSLFDELFFIPRSITGKGIRKSLNIFRKFINFKIYKTKSGKKIFDWTVPNEWVIDDAYIINPKGKKICNFKENFLHLVGYSKKINTNLNLKEIKKKIFTIPKYPNYIPYVTSYYKEDWGFCMKHNDFKKLNKGNYKAIVKSRFIKGSVDFGLTKLNGKTKKNFLLSSYLCHPNLANNELSGPLVLLGLYKRIKNWKNRNFNYFFLLNPETIGSICFIKKFKNKILNNLQGGLVLTSLGGRNKNLSYKLSKNESSQLNKLILNLEKYDKNIETRKFSPASGSDERQFCSPGLNSPIGQIARDPDGTYKEYHTSADNKSYMNIDKILNSIDQIEEFLKLNDYNCNIYSQSPYSEPQLGKRNLYDKLNNKIIQRNTIKKQSNSLRYYLTNILSLSDGQHTLVDIANKLEVSSFLILEYVKVLIKEKLITIR